MLTTSDFTTAAEPSPRNADAEASLRRATGAADALVLNSHVSALSAALASLPTGGAVVAARSDLRTLDGGLRVVDLIERAGLKLREVGAADNATLDDYAGALDNGVAGILRVAADDAWPASTARLATSELATLAHQQGAMLIEDAASAPLLGVPDDGPSAAAADALAAQPLTGAVTAGADLVIARGDGLIGGPACGVLLGTGEAIQPIAAARMTPTISADAYTSAALAATVDLLADADRFWFSVPVWSLLTTPLENLQTRAERLASKLAANGAGAEVVAFSAQESAPSGLPIRLPTAAIALPSPEKNAALADSLRQGEPAVCVGQEGGRLLVDLRTVFPRQDAELVDALLRGVGQPSKSG